MSPTVAQVEDAIRYLECCAKGGRCAPPKWNVEQTVFSLLGLYDGPIQPDKANPSPSVALQLVAARGHYLNHFHPEGGIAVPSQEYLMALAQDLGVVRQAITTSGVASFNGYGDLDANSAGAAAMAFWAQGALAAQGGPALVIVGTSGPSNGAYLVRMRNITGDTLTAVVDAATGRVRSHANQTNPTQGASGPVHGQTQAHADGQVTTTSKAPIHGQTATPGSVMVDPTGSSTGATATPLDSNSQPTSEATPPPPAGVAAPSGGLSTGAKVGAGAGLLAAAFLAWKLTK